MVRQESDFDAEIARRFGSLIDAAAAGRLHAWSDDATDALALVILLDQFPRNVHRNTPRAFATDIAARQVAEAAIARGFDKQVAANMRTFFYLPFMHSEKLADQERCLTLYQAAGDESGVKYARIHRDLIEAYGRFPHRNAILGRDSTPEERAFLETDGFKG